MDQLDYVSGNELWAWWRAAKQAAIAQQVPMSELDWFLQEVTSIDRLSLRLESFQYQPKIQLKFSFAELQSRWQQRLALRVPVQYLAGSTTWRQFSLQVSPAALIPRPETEILIDLAIELTKTYPELAHGHWADLGTGSGAIAIGLADALPHTVIHAIDTSEVALQIAQENAERLGFAQRIRFHHGSWFEPLASLKHQLSGVVSNPPYIPTAVINTLEPEVTQHEPHLALDGGVDGLDDIRHLIHTAPEYLRPGGVWLVEMMAGQAKAIESLLASDDNYKNIQIRADLAGIKRFAIACHK